MECTQNTFSKDKIWYCNLRAPSHNPHHHIRLAILPITFNRSHKNKRSNFKSGSAEKSGMTSEDGFQSFSAHSYNRNAWKGHLYVPAQLKTKNFFVMCFLIREYDTNTSQSDIKNSKFVFTPISCFNAHWHCTAPPGVWSFVHQGAVSHLQNKHTMKTVSSKIINLQ